MEIMLVPAAGFCFGVSRAVQMALAAKPCRTLGPLIHNRRVLERLEREGVRAADGLSDIPDGATVVVRAHGVGRAQHEAIRERGLACVDATCPFVAKIHRIAAKASGEGRRVVIIGDAHHPEVRGISGWCRDALVFGDAREIESWFEIHPEERSDSFTVVAQTTQNRKKWESCVNCIKKQCTNAEIFDTICNATDERQTETSAVAAKADVMLVIGDQNSSNTLKLLEISRSLCGRVILLEDSEAFDASLIKGARLVGVTAGASTPAWIIKEVMDKMSEELKKAQEAQAGPGEEQVPQQASAQTPEQAPQQVPEQASQAETEDVKEAAEESFASLLEKSIKTLYTGEKVTGTVTQITPGEIHVDLGVKQAGYIPVAELSDDPLYKPEEHLEVGQKIEAFVMRVNDVEGTIMLSKKRLDTIKGWESIEQAREDKATLEGTVVEENKGGVVASVNGVRVFVPASQTGLAKDVPMSSLLKSHVKLRITEVNRARRRVVGSIRVVQMEERRKQAEKVWETIEVGQTYQGTVKSLTSYGAFVDIGGVDGMVHISELSWSRIKHPSEVVKIGDQIEVFVLGLDREKRKISLGYRKPEDNPWNKFVTAYKVGDVATVKVLKFMPFGAFAEVIPGVDGLIHISQIADHRIAKPDDVLKEGQMVDVMITDIDMEKQKISLSIRALLEAARRAPAEEGPETETVYNSDDHKQGN